MYIIPIHVQITDRQVLVLYMSLLVSDSENMAFGTCLFQPINLCTGQNRMIANEFPLIWSSENINSPIFGNRIFDCLGMGQQNIGG